MKVFNSGVQITDKYFKVKMETPEDFETARLLLGVHEVKKEPGMYRVENNLVNSMVLGLPLNSFREPTFSYNEVEEEGLIGAEGLKPYQFGDVVKLLELRSSLNANPMGLGKTIEEIVKLRNMDATNVLIVCPHTIRHQWKEQIKNWWPSHEKLVHIPEQITERKTHTKVLSCPIENIVIINYEKLLIPLFFSALSRVVWDVIVVDEAHRIKNRNAQRTKQLKLLKAKHRDALTGTPILKHPDDLFSILGFLDWRYSGNGYWNFVNFFCKVEETFYGRKITGLTEDVDRVQLLHQILDFMSVRNTAVKTTPGKERIVVPLKMEAKQRSLYEKLRRLALDELPDTITIPNGAVLLMRCIQATTFPSVLQPDTPSIKFEWMLDWLEDNPDEKVVVFSRFSKCVNSLVAFLNSKKVGAEAYTGDNAAAVNLEHKHKFLTDDSCRVLVGTIGAMGEGVDALQNVCSTVVFMDREWSPELLRQCEDRVDRMGQTKHVVCYYLECINSVDRHIANINMHRAEDIREALNDSEEE